MEILVRTEDLDGTVCPVCQNPIDFCACRSDSRPSWRQMERLGKPALATLGVHEVLRLIGLTGAKSTLFVACEVEASNGQLYTFNEVLEAAAHLSLGVAAGA